MKKAILLTNLGSPDSTKVSDVKKYLKEFLMDERVIDVPNPMRYFLVNGMIVPFRSSESSEKYKTIWTENGSPLVHTTKQVMELTEKKSALPTYMSMRYGNPSSTFALKKISEEQKDLTELIVLPLYPHYAMSSYETAVEDIKDAHAKSKYSFKIKFIPPFYNHSDYINALAKSMKPYIQKPFDHLLFSYHGIPERHVRKSDPTKSHCLSNGDCCSVSSPAHTTCYRHQVFKTTELVAEKLQLDKSKYSISFQSRLNDKWLYPFTDVVLQELPNKGLKNILVASPAFVSDCLETLEEINIEGRETFLKAGGESFTFIPCLNTNAEWIDTIVELIKAA